ncbi:DUF397 domain-containing protein [Actinopolyspora mortivallis]
MTGPLHAFRCSPRPTSIRSNSGGNCVEVGFGAELTGVRDTKNREAG